MRRVITKDVPDGKGGSFLKAGQARDYPWPTWTGIAKSINAKGDIQKILDSFSQAEEQFIAARV